MQPLTKAKGSTQGFSMDAVQERIDAFVRLEPDDEGECHGKTTIVEELEDHLDDERVLSFYLKVVADSSEFDLARLGVAPN